MKTKFFVKRKSNVTLSGIQQDMLPTSSSVASKSRSPSLLQQVVNRKITDERVPSKDSSLHSRLSDSSLHSTNSSTYSNETNDSSSQFSPTQSLQSLSTDSKSSTGRKTNTLH